MALKNRKDRMALVLVPYRIVCLFDGRSSTFSSSSSWKFFFLPTFFSTILAAGTLNLDHSHLATPRPAFLVRSLTPFLPFSRPN